MITESALKAPMSEAKAAYAYFSLGFLSALACVLIYVGVTA